jgi:hypothetical protein
MRGRAPPDAARKGKETPGRVYALWIGLKKRLDYAFDATLHLSEYLIRKVPIRSTKMRSTASILTLWLATLTISSAAAFAETDVFPADTCCISADETAALMKLPYRDFDQNMPLGGWRKYGSIGCNKTAAVLLEQYMALRKPDLKASELSVITWHAGQLHGFDGNYSKARVDFVASLNPNEPSDSPLLWNDYVFASIAFLDHDIETLRAHRNRIERGPEMDGRKPNLNIVDNLIQFFDRPYGIAYSGGRIPLAPPECGKP